MTGGQRLAASDDFVYLTRNYLHAWAYAQDAGGAGESVVLLVKPEPPVERDPRHSDEMWAYCGSAARVAAVDDTAPIRADVADRNWKRAEGLPPD